MDAPMRSDGVDGLTPRVVRADADQRFRALASEMGFNPDDKWVGGYVDYEWAHVGRLFKRMADLIDGRSVLEFGCNLGATAISLAFLGGRVTAVDINPELVQLARANAARYGVEEAIRFVHLPRSSRLPFAANEFDCITCNSVLEYVQHGALAAVLGELDRALRPGGVLFVLGTSNRLWPREVHSRRWLTNYLPRFLDRVIFRSRSLQRGVFPWEIMRGFRGYEVVDLKDGGATFLASKAQMGLSRRKLEILKAVHYIVSPFSLTAGMLTPSISITLRKPCPRSGDPDERMLSRVDEREGHRCEEASAYDSK